MRMTNQREMILHELRRSRQHLSADELHERVKKLMPRISLATVYRNLETLSAAGVITKLEISGRQKRFDYDVREHDHIYCVRCHRVDNIKLDRKQVGQERSVTADGYRITGYRVEFFGICPACQKQPRKREEEGKMGKQAGDSQTISTEQKQILAALANAVNPCGSKEIAAATGLEVKVISGQITTLKKQELVDSPVRCKYAATEAGKKIVG